MRMSRLKLICLVMVMVLLSALIMLAPAPATVSGAYPPPYPPPETPPVTPPGPYTQVLYLPLATKNYSGSTPPEICPEGPNEICLKFDRYPSLDCICYPYDGSGSNGMVPFESPVWDDFIDPDGHIIDESLQDASSIIVESWALNNLKEGVEETYTACGVAYGIGPARFRIEAWDGRAFRYSRNVDPKERIRASIKTQIDAHNCRSGNPQSLTVLRLTKYGDPVGFHEY